MYTALGLQREIKQSCTIKIKNIFSSFASWLCWFGTILFIQPYLNNIWRYWLCKTWIHFREPSSTNFITSRVLLPKRRKSFFNSNFWPIFPAKSHNLYLMRRFHHHHLPVGTLSSSLVSVGDIGLILEKATAFAENLPTKNLQKTYKKRECFALIRVMPWHWR